MGWMVLTGGLAWGAAEEGETVDQAAIAIGRELFTRTWSPRDPRAAGGDGLGPMFNERSCVACHGQGGIGGSGSNENNVELLSARTPLSHPAAAKKVHPGLVGSSSTVLHRFSTAKGYQAWREQRVSQAIRLPDEDRPDSADAAAEFALRNTKSLKVTQPPAPQLQLSYRNSTALFGAGLIDSIPDSVIRDSAAKSVKNPATKGRVSEMSNGKIGRFGWQAVQPTLADFVLNACAVELGLNVPDHQQAASVLYRGKATTELDMDADEAAALVTFVATLPRPEEPEVPRQLVREGSQLFSQVGCANCHSPNLGEVTGIYSDLLLHEMGSSLRSGEGPGAGYYGSMGGSLPFARSKRRSPPAVARHTETEWRTPPLWGVAASAPYMHDGRAATLRIAILLHDGQGLKSGADFLALNANEQSAVLAFLQSLELPNSVEQAPLAPRPRPRARLAAK